MAFLKTHPYKAEVKFKWCFRCWTYRVIISYGHLITAVQFKLIEGGRFLRHFKGGLKCRFDSRHHTSHFACIWDLCPMLRPLLLICVLKRKRRGKKGWSKRRTHNFMPSYNKFKRTELKSRAYEYTYLWHINYKLTKFVSTYILL